MIEWLETTTNGEVFVKSSTSSSTDALSKSYFFTYYTSRNWSESYTSSSQSGEINDSDDGAVGLLVPEYSHTSTTAEFANGVVLSSYTDSTTKKWSTSTSGELFYSTETLQTTVWSLGDQTIPATVSTTLYLTDEVMAGAGYNTIYQVGGAVVDAGQIFATASPQSTLANTSQATFSTVTRFTASANNQTSTAQRVSAIVSSGNPILSDSFSYSGTTTSASSVVGLLSTGVLPQQTTSKPWTTAVTKAQTFQSTYFASQDATIENPTTTTVFYRSITKTTAMTHGGLVFDALIPSTQSTTRLTEGQKQITTASNVSQSLTYIVPLPPHVMHTSSAPVAFDANIGPNYGTSTDFNARTFYGPAGRQVGSSIGAAFSFVGFTQTFYALGAEVAFGRQSNNTADVPDFGQGPESAGTVLTLLPASYTFATGATSATVTIGSGQYSATSATTSTAQTTTSGAIQVHGQTYVGKYRTGINYRDDGEYSPLTQYPGQFIIGGNLRNNETLQESVWAGVYRINGTTTSYLDGIPSTHTSSRATSYAAPITYLQPLPAVSGFVYWNRTYASNVIAWTVARNSLGIPVVPEQF